MQFFLAQSCEGSGCYHLSVGGLTVCSRDGGTGLESRAQYEESSGLFKWLQEDAHARQQLPCHNI